MSSFMNVLRFRRKVTNDSNDASTSVDGEGNSTNVGSKGSIKENPKNRKSYCDKFVILLVAIIWSIILFVLWWWYRDSDIVWARQGVVVCDDGRCSEIGVKMLKHGGHAVDAAIAAHLCLGIITPTATSIGGGGFMVVRDAATKKTRAFNMRETAPAASSVDMYDANHDAQFKGALSAAVPGVLLGLEEAWKTYGRLKWETLFEPSIDLARKGFKVSAYLANYIQEFKGEIFNDTGLRQVYAPNGELLKEGQLCLNARLAETLEAIAMNGTTVFYNGFIGENLVNELKQKGGIITTADLKNFTVDTPNVTEIEIIKGYKILGMPPPSSGTLGVGMVTKVLGNYGNSGNLKQELDGPLGLHRLTEASKYMLGMRMHLGDPAFDNDTIYIQNMTSSKFAHDIWKQINNSKTFPREHYETSWKQIIDGGTSHVGVVDKDRNAVALTTTVNDVFGSKLLSTTTGILVNNQMGDFSTLNEKGRPSYLGQPKANLIEPGKRPMSSMSPIIILKPDGDLAGVMGGSGGPKIVAAVTQVFLNHFVHGMNPLKAVETTRIFPKLEETIDLEYENKTMINKKHIELPQYEKTFLEGRGHNLSVVKLEPVCHLIIQTKWLTRSILAGVSDLRKNAKSAGY